MKTPVLVKENPMKKKKKKKKRTARLPMGNPVFVQIMEISFQPLFVSWKYVASLLNKQLRTFVSFG